MTEEFHPSITNKLLIMRLLAIIAHDVKSPLDSILAVMSFFKEKDHDLDDYNNFMTALELHVKSSKKILEDLLNWAKLLLVEDKTLPEALVNIKVKDLTDEIIQSVQYFNLNKQISFLNNIPEDLSSNINVDLYTFVLRNLLMNSIKFSNEKGKTYINANFENNSVRISVTDEGTGIKPEKLNKILNFTGRSDRGTQNETGAGIGLMLCYDCLLHFGGKLGAKSINGKDTEFFFDIPVKVPSDIVS